jgi:hypothetical protein
MIIFKCPESRPESFPVLHLFPLAVASTKDKTSNAALSRLPQSADSVNDYLTDESV